MEHGLLRMSTARTGATRAGVLAQCHQPGVAVSGKRPSFSGWNGLRLPPLVSLVVARSPARKSPVVCKAREAVDEVKVVNDSSWNSLVLESDSPVLVAFWAPWCGPCRMIAPVVDKLTKEYGGKTACYSSTPTTAPT